MGAWKTRKFPFSVPFPSILQAGQAVNVRRVSVYNHFKIITHASLPQDHRIFYGPLSGLNHTLPKFNIAPEKLPSQ